MVDCDIFALTNEGLDKLKANVRGFVQEFERTDFQSISSAQVQAALTTHKLDIKSLEGDTYLKKCSKYELLILISKLSPSYLK